MFSSNPTTVAATWSLLAVLAMIVTAVIVAAVWPISRDPEPTQEIPAAKIARARAMVPPRPGCWPVRRRPGRGSGRHRKLEMGRRRDPSR